MRWHQEKRAKPVPLDGGVFAPPTPPTPLHLRNTPSLAPPNAQNPFLLLVQVPTSSDPPSFSVCRIWAIHPPGDAHRAQMVQITPREGGESAGYP